MNSLARMDSRVLLLRQQIAAARGDGLASRESLIRSQLAYAARLQCLVMLRMKRVQEDIALVGERERELLHTVRVARLVRSKRLPVCLAEHITRVLERRKETT